MKKNITINNREEGSINIYTKNIKTFIDKYKEILFLGGVVALVTGSSIFINKLDKPDDISFEKYLDVTSRKYNVEYVVQEGDQFDQILYDVYGDDAMNLKAEILYQNSMSFDDSNKIIPGQKIRLINLKEEQLDKAGYVLASDKRADISVRLSDYYGYFNLFTIYFENGIFENYDKDRFQMYYINCKEIISLIDQYRLDTSNEYLAEFIEVKSEELYYKMFTDMDINNNYDEYIEERYVKGDKNASGFNPIMKYTPVLKSELSKSKSI